MTVLGEAPQQKGGGESMEVCYIVYKYTLVFIYINNIISGLFVFGEKD